MKKLLCFLLALSMPLTLLTGCGDTTSSPKETLNVLLWDGYLPQDVTDSFQAETGIKMNFSNFDTNEEMLTKLQAGGAGYDLVIGSDYILDQIIKEDLAQPLDKTQIPNYANLDPSYLSQYYDLDNQYTVPYGPGTPLIVYDKNKIGMEIKGYKDLWDPQLKGKLVLLDDARNMVGITLKSMGKSMNETDPTVLAEAKEKLMKLKPNVHHLDYNNPHESIISGEADIAYMFTPQVLLALQARPELSVVYPEEGMGFGIDCWFVPTSASNKENAYKFLNYILDAKVGASISEQILYQCPNKASQPYLSEEYKANKALYIPADVLGKTEFIKDVGTAATTYDEIWTAFKQ